MLYLNHPRYRGLAHARCIAIFTTMKTFITPFIVLLLICLMYVSGLYSHREFAIEFAVYASIACLIFLIAFLRSKFSGKK